MKKICYYFNLYKTFLKNSFSREMDYRASFIGDLFDSIINLSISVLFFKILYSKVNLISGWNQYEVLFLVGYAKFIVATIFTLFMNNLPRIQRYILAGELDFIIIKPCDTQFFVSCRYFYFGGFAGLFPALILMFYSSIKLNTVNISITSILIIIVLVLCSLILAYSLWFILMTFAFYVIKVNQLYELFLSTLIFMEYPESIYKGFISLLFTFLIPVILISSIPVEFIINRITLSSTLKMVLITVIFSIFSRIFWKISIKKYQSASS